MIISELQWRSVMLISGKKKCPSAYKKGKKLSAPTTYEVFLFKILEFQAAFIIPSLFIKVHKKLFTIRGKTK